MIGNVTREAVSILAAVLTRTGSFRRPAPAMPSSRPAAVPHVRAQDIQSSMFIGVVASEAAEARLAAD